LDAVTIVQVLKLANLLGKSGVHFALNIFELALFLLFSSKLLNNLVPFLKFFLT
jgi:hypothetical protein